MRGAVDPPSEPGHDDQALLAKVVRQPPREPACRRRGIACSDHRHGLPVEETEVALRDQQWRRILELGQQARVKPLPDRQPLRAELVDTSDLALGLSDRAQGGRLATAPPRKVGHGG